MNTRFFLVRLFAVVLFFMTAISFSYAQDMGTQIGQVLAKLQEDSTPKGYQNCIASLKGIDAQYPGSTVPKYQIALQSLTYAVRNPHAKYTDEMLADAEEAIRQMQAIPDADQSDILTLKGFYYMVYIVKDPAFNGPLYYADVIGYYAKALKLNPDNQLAQHLQQKFYEGMSQQM